MELMMTLQLMNHTTSKHGSQIHSQELKFFSSLVHLMRYWSKKHKKLVTQMFTGNSKKFTVMLIIISNVAKIMLLKLLLLKVLEF